MELTFQQEAERAIPTDRAAAANPTSSPTPGTLPKIIFGDYTECACLLELNVRILL